MVVSEVILDVVVDEGRLLAVCIVARDRCSKERRCHFLMVWLVMRER